MKLTQIPHGKAVATQTRTPRGNPDGCEKKAVAGKAIRKNMKTKGGLGGQACKDRKAVSVRRR
jgi:hypothetical protein